MLLKDTVSSCDNDIITPTHGQACCHVKKQNILVCFFSFPMN